MFFNVVFVRETLWYERHHESKFSTANHLASVLINDTENTQLNEPKQLNTIKKANADLVLLIRP